MIGAFMLLSVAVVQVDARLDPAARRLDGVATITVTNPTPAHSMSVQVDTMTQEPTFRTSATGGGLSR